MWVYELQAGSLPAMARSSARPRPPSTACRSGWGRLARRPELDKALLVARAGDQLVITKLDRLGRSLEHLIALSNDLQARGVGLVVLDQGILRAG